MMFFCGKQQTESRFALLIKLSCLQSNILYTTQKRIYNIKILSKTRQNVECV